MSSAITFPFTTTHTILDSIDALVLCFAGLSLTKSRKELDDDGLDAAQPRTKRLKIESSRPVRIPHSSILHRLRPVKRAVLISRAPVPASTPPPVVPAPRGPFVLTVREVTVAVRPTLSKSEERELHWWNALCDKQRTDFSAHAPRHGPVTITIPESREEYEFRKRWDAMCTDHYLSPHAPDRSDPREAASSTDSSSITVASPSAAQAIASSTTSSPTLAMSTTPSTPAPMSKKAKGKHAVGPAAASSSTNGNSIKRTAGPSSSALQDITNGGERGRGKSKGKGKIKDICGKTSASSSTTSTFHGSAASSSSTLHHITDGGNDYKVKVKDIGVSINKDMGTSGSTSGVQRTQKKDNGGGKALLSWTIKNSHMLRAYYDVMPHKRPQDNKR